MEGRREGERSEVGKANCQVTPDPRQYSTFVQVPMTSGDATRVNVSAYYHLVGSQLAKVFGWGLRKCLNSKLWVQGAQVLSQY